MRNSDFYTGILFIAIGLLFGVSALTGLTIGTAFRMGPGYFPLLLAILLVGIGLSVMGKTGFRFRRAIPGEAKSGFSPRAMIALTLAPVLFGFIVSRFGMVPATLVAVAVSAFASKQTTWPFAAKVSVVLTTLCVLIFHYGLKLTVPLFAASL